MLVSRWVLHQRRGVDTGLRGKGGRANIRRLAFRGTVEQLVKCVGQARDGFQLVGVDADFEPLGEMRFERQGGGSRDGLGAR